LAHWGIDSFCIDGRYIQDHFPGIGRYTYNLIDALARVAPDDAFTVLHNPALRNTRYDIAALARHPNVALRRIDVPTFSLAEQCGLPFAIRPSQFAVFHSPYYIKPYYSRVSSVVTIFDLIPLRVLKDSLTWRARLFFRLAVSLAARTAARIIAPSVATRADLVTLLRVPREKIDVIPLAADACFAPQPAAEIARVRAKYALPDEYVLSVGINKPHKNIAALIEAWQSLGDTSRTLVIAGAWDAQSAQQAAVENRKPVLSEAEGSRIQFIHNVDDRDLPALYSGAAVFVMPSLYEGFGLPTLEAMACGAPVICSNTSSLPEVVGDPSSFDYRSGGSGQAAAILVDPRAVDEIAGAIERVLSDAALRDELRAKSLARAALFSWERTARETLAVYHSVVPK
jgi:glycosyltransferase involved in cell wall biosynthesis